MADTGHLFGQLAETGPGHATRPMQAEIGVNFDECIEQDTSQLTELWS